MHLLSYWCIYLIYYYYYYYYYSLLHHTSQKKAITKGEGKIPGCECSCVRGCVHVRVCARAYAYVWVHLYAR